MNNLKTLLLLLSLTIFVTQGVWAAQNKTEVNEQYKLAPVPIDDLELQKRIEEDRLKAQAEEATKGLSEGEKQLIENTNREAILKNWTKEIAANDKAITGKYEHITKKKAIVLLLKDNKEHKDVVQIAKDYAKLYGVAENTIRMKSPEIYTLLVDLDEQTDQAKTKNDQAHNNKMMVYIYQQKGRDDYLTIYVLGKTEFQDLMYIVDDFFKQIS